MTRDLDRKITDASIAEAVTEILRLAHGLSARLKGTPEMYEANKILHAAWRIQDVLTATKPHS